VPKTIAIATALVSAIMAGVAGLPAQNTPTPLYRVNVRMVVLTFGVVDAKGDPVSGLGPEDVRIFEDGIPQKLAAFAEGSNPSLRIAGENLPDGGTSVFILFDTSDRMYRMFPYVCDSIADFIRKLDPADSVAIYTFSRNLLRATPLTNNHLLARAGLRNAVAGDDTALFNCLLLTLRDAAKVEGRKAIVVFSNGPDNVSMVTPDDVGRVAEDEGIPVYIISTNQAGRDSVLADALQRLTGRTGGKLYLAGNWQHQARAFAAIRQDIAGSYTAWYYPAPNPNEAFRNIRVEIVRPSARQYRVRARAGYQVKPYTHGPSN
jgi:VWFA-related protein